MMRFSFKQSNIPNLRDKLTLVSDQDRADEVDQVINVLSEDDRTLTAQALAACNADICALQEVENLVTLTAFNNRYLRKYMRRGYGHRMLKEGNDGRGIDVAGLSRMRPVDVISHAKTSLSELGIAPMVDQDPNDPAFRRDCLQLEYEISGRALTVFVCHFKSMHGGRWETRPVREQEALGVRRIIERRFDDPKTSDWIICGDFNDYLEQDGQIANDHGLSALVDGGFSIDALMASDLSDHDRWTHHYPREASYSALDHIFMSPNLFEKNAQPKVTISRMGLPWRAERYTGYRLPGVAWSKPKASDHCPISLEFML